MPPRKSVASRTRKLPASTSTGDTNTGVSESPMAGVLKSLQVLYQKGEGVDLTITCDNRQWRIHRWLAESQSPWIKTVCGSQFKESQTKTIDFPDTKPQVVNAMIEFLYGHEYKTKDIKVNDDTPEGANAFQAMVFVFADQYLFAGLKSFALKRFIAAADTEYHTPGFLAVIEMIYNEDSICADGALKDAVVENVAKHQFQKSRPHKDSAAFQDLLRRLNDFSADVVMKMSSMNTVANEYECPSACGGIIPMFIDPALKGMGSYLSTYCPKCGQMQTRSGKDWENWEKKKMA